MASPYLNELTALQTSIQSFTSGLKQNFLTSADLLSANSIDYNVPFLQDIASMETMFGQSLLTLAFCPIKVPKCICSVRPF